MLLIINLKKKTGKKEDNIYVLGYTTHNDISVDNNTRQKCKINLDFSKRMAHQIKNKNATSYNCQK